MGHVTNFSFLKSKRNKLLVLASALVLSFAFVACGPTGDEDPVVDNPCKDDATLCTPRATLVDTGEIIFQGNCTGCHGSDAHGYAGSTPPLANSDFFINNRHRTIRIVLGGYDAVPITVNGLNYEGSMPSWSTSLTNVEIAGVLTYLRTVKNDSTIDSCNALVLDDNGFAACTKVARSPAAMALDTVAVWEVKAVRDSLIAAHVITD